MHEGMRMFRDGSGTVWPTSASPMWCAVTCF